MTQDYQIKAGNTLAKIAKQYGVTVQELAKENNIKNGNLIFAGQTLKIPVESEEAFNITGLTVESTSQQTENDVSAKTSETEPLTDEERHEAMNYGKDVSDYLVGYTDAYEEHVTIDVIRSHVNDRNVVDFLYGYEDNRGLGDHFFRQLITECGFDEKQDLMKEVAEKLSAYLKANGESDLAKEIDVIIAKGNFTKEDADILDKITKNVINKFILLS